MAIAALAGSVPWIFRLVMTARLSAMLLGGDGEGQAALDGGR